MTARQAQWSAAAWPLVLAALSFLSSSDAFCQEPRPVTEQDAWARPILVVPPSFPEDIPAGMLPVVIRVEGTVSAEGNFESPVFSPTEGKEQFIEAITKVLRNWRFRPGFDSHCTIRETRAVLE